MTPIQAAYLVLGFLGVLVGGAGLFTFIDFIKPGTTERWADRIFG